MTISIALAGKGGTGKTTIAALIIQALMEQSQGPLLAIDADPAANLHLALGLPMPATVGEIREEMSDAAQARQLGVAISRHDYLKHEVQMALEEGAEIDLLAMGRPEGPGCYCAANHLLRQVIDELSKNYRYVVIDNEAGMEHISRRTTQDVDLLLLITDPTVRGVRTAGGMAQLAQDLEIEVRRMLLLVNRVERELPAQLQEAIDGLQIEVGALIPADEEVNRLDALGEPLLHLGEASPAAKAMRELTAKILLELQPQAN